MHTGNEKRLVKKAKRHKCSKLNFHLMKDLFSIKHKSVCHMAK